MIAINDYAQIKVNDKLINPQLGKKNPGKVPGKNPGPRNPASQTPQPPKGVAKCKYGSRCWRVVNEGKCDDWHTPEEFKEMKKQ